MAAAIGTSVSASTSAAIIAAMTAAASGWYIRPSIPVMPKSGRNTTITMKVAKAIGRATSTAAETARSRRSRRVVKPLSRCRMFSTMMIAASTSRPTAIASPPRVIVFNPTSAASGGGPRATRAEWSTSPRVPWQVAEQQQNHEHHEDAAQHHRAPTPPNAELMSCDW
jgi:hypothetical protein